MTFLIENSSGEVFEVTDLFDRDGNSTTDISAATACVIRLSEERWVESEVLGPIYRVH